MKKRQIASEHSEIKYHTYRGIDYFTAIYNDHIVLEPVHEEVLKNLNENTIDREILWSDSTHTWARGMSLDEQRQALLKSAIDDIDWLLSQKPLRELNTEYREKRERLVQERKFFLSLAQRDVKE